MREVIEGKRTLYFKRHYADGRTRRMRLAATDFVTSHLARAMARGGNSPDDTEIEQRTGPEPAPYRQDEVESTKAAMGQAPHPAPGHRVASANLMRVSGKAETNVSAITEIHAASAKPMLSAWKPDKPAVSLGLAVEYLMKKPAFAKLPFGEWSQVLVNQINRGHFCFIVNEHRRTHGFFGWALTQQHLAEEWVEDRHGLRDEDCRDGDCVIFNAWAADSLHVHRFMVDTGRKIIEGKRTLYFKRHYSDGRTRPVRLAATDFVTSHLARAAAPRP